MFRSAQPGQFSTYHIQNIDIPCLAVLIILWLSMSKSKNSPLSPSIIIDTLRTPASRPLSSAEYSWRDEAQVMNISGARQRCENGDMEVMTPHHTPAQYQPRTSAVNLQLSRLCHWQQKQKRAKEPSVNILNIQKFGPRSKIWAWFRQDLEEKYEPLLVVAAGWAAGAIPWAPIFKPRQLITIIITRQHRPYNTAHTTTQQQYNTAHNNVWHNIYCLYEL